MHLIRKPEVLWVWNILKHVRKVKSKERTQSLQEVQIKIQTVPAALLYLFRNYDLPNLEYKGSFLGFTLIAVVVETASSFIFEPFIASG